MKNFAIIVAFDSKYGIGKNGQLPWVLPSDLKHFKEITTGVVSPDRKNAVIMGRKTWESLPAKFRPLPNRVNLVLSHQENCELPHGVFCSQSLNEGLSFLSGKQDIENIFVIGGAQIFSQAIDHPLCQKLYVTHIDSEYACDTFFPSISRQFFPISASEPNEDNGIKYHFSDYLRY